MATPKSNTKLEVPDSFIIIILLGLGLLFNMSTWYHPIYYPIVKWSFIGLLPIFLFLGIKKSHYYLWFIVLIFFTQDSFPNNVLYETYYGYEAATVYFHNFISIFSVFDVVILSILYLLILKKLVTGQVRNLFSGRWEYYGIWFVILLSLFIGLAKNNDFKIIFAEVQGFFYATVIYIIIMQTNYNKEILLRTIIFLVVFLAITIPIEFIHYIYTNYHSLLAVVGRIRKPMVNGIDDTYMVLPIFLTLSWMVEKEKRLSPFYQALGIFILMLSLAVIYLNTGRMLILLTAAGIAIFIVSRRLNWRAYIVMILVIGAMAGMSLLLQPEHITRIGQMFTSIISATQNLNKDMSAADRVLEFYNVHETLKDDHSLLFGNGWGGLWREYYYQPGRGSLAAYADKTLTIHRQTHVIFSNLFIKCGYFGAFVICLCIASLWYHFYRVYRKMKEVQLKQMMLGFLFTFPIFFYFSTVLQLGIVFGMILAFMRKIELLDRQEPEIE